jgi:serine/threonine protein kinase
MRAAMNDQAAASQERSNNQKTFWSSLGQAVSPIDNLESDELQSSGQKNFYKELNPTDFFTYDKVIGSGSYASVRIAVEKKTGKKVAVKIYEKIKLLDPEKLNNVKNEIEILKEIHHENVVGLLRGFETFRQIHLVMEYVSGCSLEEFLRGRAGSKVSEPEAKIIIKQLARALQYLHGKGIAHRDIKLENVLLEDNSVIKLIDFGFAVKKEEQKNQTDVFCGTPHYMAPEITTKQKHEPMPTDIWAVGVLLYRLIDGDFPFKASSDRELFNKISQCKYEIPSSWSLPLSDLLTSILNPNPLFRPSITSVFFQFSSYSLLFIDRFCNLNG